MFCFKIRRLTEKQPPLVSVLWREEVGIILHNLPARATIASPVLPFACEQRLWLRRSADMTVPCLASKYRYAFGWD